MKHSEILHEYLVLNPFTPANPVILKDRKITGIHLIREYKNKLILYFLESGQTLSIPYDYIKLMRSLDIKSGEKIHYSDMESYDRLNLFISGLSKFVKLLDTTSEESEEAVEILITLASLGTTEFREFMETHDLYFKPWIYEEPGKTLEL